MTDPVILGLRSKDLWQIYEAENPLAEALRKIGAIAREGARENMPLAVEDWEASG